MGRNKKVECTSCGRLVQRGFALMNHEKCCTTMTKYLKDNNHYHNEDYINADDIGVEDGHAQGDDFSIATHMDVLERLGTLDIKHVLQYVGWGKVELSAKDLEVCRFLRSVEMGGGASHMSMRASLDYVRSVGGRGDLLPKTVRTCWSRVEKVRYFNSQCSLHTIITNVRSNERCMLVTRLTLFCVLYLCRHTCS
jgi:hypothetical protein